MAESQEEKAQRLIDESSFGEKDAKKLAGRTPTEVADEIVRKLREESEKNK